MKIYGLQKMTLLDFPGHVACTVFLSGCNFCCPFCHNFQLATGSSQPLMDDSELLKFLESRRALLDGVAITGGEPCMNVYLPSLLYDIKALGYKIKLDTNGSYPDMLNPMIETGLVDYVAMDIKNSPSHYAKTIGINNIDLSPIEQSIELLIKDCVDYEFRTTVVNELHSEEDFLEIGRWIKGAKRYFLQPFTDRDTVPFEGLTAPTKETMMRYADVVKPFVSDVQIRGMD